MEVVAILGPRVVDGVVMVAIVAIPVPLAATLTSALTSTVSIAAAAVAVTMLPIRFFGVVVFGVVVRLVRRI